MLDSAYQDSISVVIEVDQKNSYDDYDTVEYRVRLNTLQIDQKQFLNTGRWRWRLLGRVKRFYDNSFGHDHFIDFFYCFLFESND